MNTNTFLSTICDYQKVEHMVYIYSLKMIKSNISLNFKYTSCIKHNSINIYNMSFKKYCLIICRSLK